MQDTRIKSSRLLINKGIVFLRMAGMPSVACTLLEISDESCRCSAQLQALAAESVAKWKSVLQPGQCLEVDLSAPPHLPGIHCGVRIEQAALVDDHSISLDLVFASIEADELQTLQSSLRAIAKTGTSTALPVTRFNKEVDAPQPRAFDPQKTQIMRGAQQYLPVCEPQGNPFEFADQWQAHVQDPALLTAIPDKNMCRGMRIGEILAMMGKLDPRNAAEAQQVSNPLHKRIGHYLVRRGLVTPKDLCVALALQADLPIINLKSMRISKSLAADFTYLTLLRYGFVPFSRSGLVLRIAATAPLSAQSKAELKARCGVEVETYLAEDDAVTAALYELGPQKDRKLRKHIRYEIALPVSVRLYVPGQDPFSQPEFGGQTVNVSEGGLLVRATKSLQEQGSCCGIHVTLPPHRTYGVFGLRYIKDDKAKDTALYGFEMLEMEDSQHSALKQICIRAGMAGSRDRWHRRRKCS